jgi:hypothetical protein
METPAITEDHYSSDEFCSQNQDVDVEESIHLVTIGRKAKAHPDKVSLTQTDRSMHFAQMNHLFQ